MKYQKTKEVLNQLVADLSQMAMVIHQTHWYMRGTNFLKLHPLMDEFMDEINAQLDVISERLITLDGEPFSTLSEMADHTGIKDEKGSFGKERRSAWQRLSKIIAIWKSFIKRALKFLMRKKITALKTFSSDSRLRLKRRFG